MVFREHIRMDSGLSTVFCLVRIPHEFPSAIIRWKYVEDWKCKLWVQEYNPIPTTDSDIHGSHIYVCSI